MNNSIQPHEPNGVVETPGNSPGCQRKLSGMPRAPASRRTLQWLAGLACLLLATAEVSAQGTPAGCTGSGLGINLFTSIPDVHIGDTISYSATVFNGLVGTGRTVCDATEIEAFVVTPDGKTNTINLVRTTLHNGESDFYPNVATYVVRAQDIQPNGALLATANDFGNIHQNDVPSRGGGFQGVNTQVNQPCVRIAAVCVSGVGENGAITFSGTVTNCGNNTLVAVTVTNFVNNGAFTVLFPKNMATGEVAGFTGSWIPLNPCGPNSAVLTVLATDQFTSTPRTVTDFITITCQNSATPGIQVTKSCPTQPVSPGQLLVYSGTVKNTGDVTLNSIVVVDNAPALDTPVFTLASLAPGAIANFTGSYLAPTNCSVSDTLVATATSRCGVAVSSSASATCPILTTPQIVVTALCPATSVVPGGLVSYTGTVRNAGNITLTNVVVVSDVPTPNTPVFAKSALAPGESSAFSGSYTLPANSCSVTTTLSGTAKDICTLIAVTNGTQITCGVATAPAVAITLACPAVSANTGGSITYSGTVRNTGDVSLSNVRVLINQPTANTPVIGPLTLAPGASRDFNATFTAPIDSCSVSGTVTVTGKDDCSAVLVSNTASATCTLITTPSIAVTEICPSSPVVPGGLLTYSGTVKNTGNITLTNVVVLNDASGATPVYTAATMAPGAIASFTGSYLAPTNCSTTSTSTATAESTCGVTVTSRVSATCPILTTPVIVTTMACSTNALTPGASATYFGRVRNGGNITLTNVVVVSDVPAANTTVFTQPSLAPGEFANFNGAYTVPASVCSVTATLKGTAQDICTLGSVTNSASTTCKVVTTPAIVVSLLCPAVSVNTGGAVSYTGTVRNTGDVALFNVRVLSNQPITNKLVLGPMALAVGASADFTLTFTTPLDACSVSTTVTATGDDNCTSALVMNTASATCTLITTPAMGVSQTCPVGPANPGGLLTYIGTVANSGNVTLTNVVVMNDLSGATPVFTAATLAPGVSTNFTGSYTVPVGSGCSVTSRLTGTGNDKCTGIQVSASMTKTCPILTSPEIEVTQTCPTDSVLPGGILNYTGTVSNPGNITLTNIIVYDNRPASNTVIFTAASLAPGASANFSGSFQVPTNCCVVWSTVAAVGQGCDGARVSDTDTHVCTVLTLPRLVVTKTCAPGVLQLGDLLTYSGTVSNAGNITVINVTVANDRSSKGTPLLGPIDLAPGESMSYSASYIVPADFCGTDTVTASGLNVCTLLPVSDSVTSTCPVTTPAPIIAVTKNCPLVPPLRGGLYTYTGTVSNPGQVTLVDVFVVDNEPSNNAPVIGPITIGPGVTVSFTNSYIAPSCCCFILETLTARGQDRCFGSNVTATATSVCPYLTSPSIAVVQHCPASPLTAGSLYQYSGYVTNTGDVVLTNVMVLGPQGTNVMEPGLELAPGESEEYSGFVTIGSNPGSVTVTASGQAICDGKLVSNTASCPVAGPTPPVISTVRVANGVFTLAFATESGQSYTVQYKNSLSDPTWIDLKTLLGTGGTQAITDAIGTQQKARFYRIFPTP